MTGKMSLLVDSAETSSAITSGSSARNIDSSNEPLISPPVFTPSNIARDIAESDRGGAMIRSKLYPEAGMKTASGGKK
jgi:hypothetical protein